MMRSRHGVLLVLGLLLAGGLTGALILEAADLSKDEKKKRRQQLAGLKKQYEELGQDSSERGLLLMKIGELRIPEAAGYLAETLANAPRKNSYVAEACIRGLAKDGSEFAIQTILTKGFEALEPRRYSVIGDSVKEFPDPKAVEWIVTKGWKSLPTLEPAGQDEWIRVLEATRDPRSVRAARGLIGDRRCVPTTLVSLLELLQANPVKSDAKKVAKLFRIQDRNLQVEVLYTLRALEATGQSKLFFKGLKSRHWEVQVAAIDVLAGTRQREVIPELTPLLQGASTRVRVAAVQALGEFGGDEVMKPLIGALEKETNGRIKDDIAEWLVKLTGKDFGLAATNWQSWWDQNKGKVEIAAIGREEYEKIKEDSENASTGVGNYFGLRVISEHTAFIVDTSNSMAEPYLVEKKKKPKPGDGGKTHVPEDKGKGKDSNFVKRTKMEVAREEMTNVLQHLADGNQFNIIPFSSFHKSWKPTLVAMDDAIRMESLSYVAGFKPGGMTNVYDTLMFALADPDVNTLYFLSDGAPTMGTILETEAILKEIAAINRLRKVKIYTIGFHLDPKATELMQKLAEQNYGRFVKR